MNSTNEFDYIIVGGGSAGCVVASRLSEDTAVNVLLIEAGAWDDAPGIHDAGRFRELWGSEYDWSYTTTAQQHLGGRAVPCPRGRVLGGSGSINGMLYVRGNPRDFDHWQSLGNKGWGYRDVLPYFLKSEHYDGPGSEHHAHDGPLAVRQKSAEDSTGTELAFVEAVAQFGFDEPVMDFNGERQENGAGFHQVTVSPDGTRASTSTAFLRAALGRPNLRVATDALTTRVCFDGSRARGVQYSREGQMHEAVARAEVVLCAGAIDSPKLLMLSGVGRPDALREHGIDCVADLPGVGRHLQDHLITGVAYASRTPAEEAAVGEVGLFLSTPWDTGVAGPDLQFHFFRDLHLGPASLVGDPGAPGFTIAPTLLQPRSEGQVTLRSADPRDPARIDPRFLADEDDARALAFGIRMARELAHMPAFTPFRGPELAPGPDAVTSTELKEYIINHVETVFHPVGTCAMGHHSESVVDDQLRVHGVEGLRVIDASVMPRIVSANTHAATIMIGELGADLVRNGGRAA
ncbi:GMC family oxidoreductase [Streptomyces sp. NRRL F-5755]|uniref:GMC family oxidoreductase n=1 Tax=Streptomyces sp. NRRL F-5755 TaxID=1519475 RepID=UPI0006AF20C4|nr:GMC family oxidoreductase N-terminal domain-containing protein [Streptomyces sp. NRRL F-5755]